MSIDPDMEALFGLSGEAFESKRAEILNREIDKIRAEDPEVAARALAQQWCLEKRLDKIKNPVVRFEVMQQMFWEQFRKFQKSFK